MSNTNAIVVPGRAHIFIAPIGTVAPTSSSMAMPTGWVDVGYTTPDSLSFTTAPTFGTVTSHQSDGPVRVFQTGDAARIDVDLEEFSSGNLINVFGGGSIVIVTPATVGPPPVPAEYQYNPPLVGQRKNVAVIAEVVDGLKRYRYVVPQAFQDAGVTEKLAKTANTTLPLRLAALFSDGVVPWYLLSNDPAMAPAS